MYIFISFRIWVKLNHIFRWYHYHLYCHWFILLIYLFMVYLWLCCLWYNVYSSCIMSISQPLSIVSFYYQESVTCCLSVCLSVWLLVCLSVCLLVCLSVCLCLLWYNVYSSCIMSIRQPLSMVSFLSGVSYSLSVCLSVCLVDGLSVCLYVSPDITFIAVVLCP